MNRLLFPLLALAFAATLTGCQRPAQEANRDHFTAAINDFLAKRGHFCLGKYDWPIDVTSDDQTARTSNAVQMPVLEKLGLVTGKDMQVERTDAAGHRIVAQARRYSLTESGQKYYVHVPVVVKTATSQTVHPADFCAGTLRLDKVVGWEPPTQQNGQTVSSVLYTYHIDPAPWAKDAQVQQVFPWIKRVIEGDGTMQLRAGVHLTPDGWVADEVFQR